MAKKKPVFVCDDCGNEFSVWSGQCNSCKQWNTLKEFRESALTSSLSGSVPNPNITATSLTQVTGKEINRLLTGMKGFDHFFGGGLVPGGVTLFSGEPGVGKSTYILQVAARWAQNGGSVLYVSGEESRSQIRLRAERLDTVEENIEILTTQNIEDICLILNKKEFSLVIIDSIQTVKTSLYDSPPGSPVQLKAALNTIIQVVKEKSIPIFVIGHITKSGDIAGPKILEHLVDSVIYLEKDDNEILRILRAFKNRYGTVEETLILRMSEKGLIEVGNPGAVYLTNSPNPQPGVATGAFLNGIRPILCEIQTLVKKSFAPSPKRLSANHDNSRLQLLTAVAEKHAGLNFYEMDIYTSIVGGMKISDTGLDLPLLGAIFSAYFDLPFPEGSFLVGEVGLVGEVRKCRLMEKRIKEAKTLGFTNFIGPFQKPSPEREVILHVKDLLNYLKNL